VRLFIAIELPNEIRAELSTFVKELHDVAPKVKWVRAENLHVTLKFLGNTDPSRLGSIKNALQLIRSPQPIELSFHGLGFFPSGTRPRVFWVGMESSASLISLAQNIDHAVHALGFPLDDRPFTPHLTLARLEPPGLPPNLAAAISKQPSRNFGSMTAREFHLIESKLKSTGAEYTTVQSFPFVAET
jgi:RNA 2',3'-cyclic 3'-phosphodiesterase